MSLQSGEYCPPSWSSLSNHQYALEVIKNGVVISEMPLPNKEFILIGKQPDICDVVLDNPSISRKHAVIQFKSGDIQPHVYDLGSTHGTFVNVSRLPSRCYHKLNCFDNISFGRSNREYILRCKDLEIEEEPKEEETQEKLTEFQKVLQRDAEASSKEELKQKYLDLLQNDPYHNSTLTSRQFVGKKQEKKLDGINWGISDETEVYNYRNQQEYQLEPSLLRRLPINDQRVLDRIGELQTVLNKYQQVESELRDLTGREQKQFGLTDKLVNKKESMQRRMVQIQQELEKHQDFIKTNLFGELSTRNVSNEIKEKQHDTFEGDEFYDRTLQKKQVIDLEALRKETYFNTTDDYYKLKQKLDELQSKEALLNKRLIEATTKQTVNTEDMDEYELFMHETDKKLKEQAYKKAKQQIRINDQILKITRDKLSIIHPTNLTETVVYQNNLSQTFGAAGKKTEDLVIGNVLRQLDDLRREEQQIDETDTAIFKIYQKKSKLTNSFKRQHYEAFQPEAQKEELQDYPGRKPQPVLPESKPNPQAEQNYEDLTRFN